MNSYNLLILLSFFYSFSIGQSFKLNDKPEKIVKNQIELSHDNDFLQFTDRYYTAGNFITYRRLLKNKMHKRQNSFFLGQEIYTPSDLEETDISKLDRPYASYLGFNFQHTVTGDDWIFDFLYFCYLWCSILIKVLGIILLYFFYLLIDASLKIHSISFIKLMPAKFAISGTNDNFVMPGWVLISSK